MKNIAQVLPKITDTKTFPETFKILEKMHCHWFLKEIMAATIG